jgi:peptidoglycan/LPS O-acetylase OafA/YrhL
MIDAKDLDARPTRRLGHVPALDGLRGVAVLLVIVWHTEGVLVPTKVTLVPGPLKGAYIGVDIFFVLSGFLITSLLLGEHLDRGRIRLGAFYQRRALRLLPALYALLLIHVCYTAATGLSLHTAWLGVRAALVYMSNWAWKWDGLKSDGALGHLWSLSVEEQFYVVWPAVMIGLLALRRRVSTVTAIMTAAIVAVAVHRAVMWHNGTSWLFLYLRTDTRADSLLVGALLAHLWVRGWSPRRGVVATAWCATLILGGTVVRVGPTRAFMYLGGFTLVALCTAAVILAAVDGRWVVTRVLELRPLRAVGRVSYGLYLWSLPVFIAVNRYGTGWGAPARVVVGLVIAAALTVLSWTFLERPIMGLRNRRRTRLQIEATK